MTLTLKTFLVVSGLAGLASAVDSNQNGMSDVWESLYPQAAGLPEGDPDGDGRTNLEESLAWTDPGDPDSRHDLELGEISGVEIAVSQGTEEQIRYDILSSLDLLAWTRETQLIGNGEVQSENVEAAPERKFFKGLTKPSLNNDYDSLSDLEEKIVGTHPRLTDTDGDGVNDDVEFTNGTDPLVKADSDNDGLSDDFERVIILDDPADNIATLADVLPGDDYDDDSVSNQEEYDAGSSPIVPVKNIVFCITEDQSYHLGHFGTVGLPTPNLDQLCRDGVVFKRGFTLSPVCSPSKMAILTGAYPHTNAGVDNVPNYGVDFPLPSPLNAANDPSNLSRSGVHEDLPTLVNILNENGIFTAVSSKTHTQPVRKFQWQQGYGNLNTTRTPAGSVGVMNDVVADAGDRPFFFWFNIAAPHLPFPSQLIQNGVWDADGGLVGDGGATNIDANAIEVLPFYPDVPAVRQDIADYYGNIATIDTVVDAVLDRLTELGIREETLVIYTSDHGIGTHRAKQSVYGAGLHVPFIFEGKDVSGGREISEPVSHLDLAPTILDFWNIPRPSHMLGESLLPILAGASDLPNRDTVLTAAHEKYNGRAVCDGRFYYIENITKPSSSTGFVMPNEALNQDQWKAGPPWFNRIYDATVAAQNTHPAAFEFLNQIVNGTTMPDVELYDMDNDLWMVNNLAEDPEYRSVIDRLKPELERWRRVTEDYNVDSGEIVRRTRELYFDPNPTVTLDATNGLDAFDYVDGPLDGEPDWVTLTAGNGGAVAQVVSGVVEAAGGPYTLTENQRYEARTDGTFTLSVDVGFSAMGVAAGVAFDIQPNSEGGFDYWQALLKDGRSAAGGSGIDVIVQRIEGSLTQVSRVLTMNDLGDYPNGFALAPSEFFKVALAGEEGGTAIDLVIENPDGSVYFSLAGLDLGMAVTPGSGVGITTWSSGSAVFDNFGYTFPVSGANVSDDFETGSGNLNDDALWTTELFGNGGGDFALVPDAIASGTAVDAPAGPVVVASHDASALPAGQSFTARVKTGFSNTGIFGGLFFGATGNGDGYALMLGDSATANAAVNNRTFKLARIQIGSLSNVLFPAANSLPLVVRDRYYEVLVSGSAGSAMITYAITDLTTSTVIASGTTTLPGVIAAGSRFGIVANSSNNSTFDDFEVVFQP